MLSDQLPRRALDSTLPGALISPTGADVKLEVIRVIDDDGQVIHPEREPRLSGDEHRKVLHALIRIRMVDERMLRLQRQGRLGFYVSTTGEEATHMRIPRLRDRAAPHRRSTRVFRRDEPEIRHELARMTEAREVAEFRDEGNRGEERHAAQCL